MATVAEIKMKGLVPIPKGTSLNIRTKPSTTFPSLALVKNTDLFQIGILTGQGLTEQGTANIWWLVTLHPSFIAKYLPKQTYGWVRSDVTNFITQDEWNKTIGSGNPGQSIVDKLIETDKEVWKKLSLSSVYLDKLKKKNINVSKYQAIYDGLLTKFNTRQLALKSSTALKVQIGTNEAWNNFVKNAGTYDTSMSMMGIGAIPVLAIVISALVGVAATITVYYTFRPKYDESRANLVVSSDLALALSKVDAETAAAIKADLEKQIDKAYNAGANAGFWSGTWNIIKYPVIFIGGFLVFDRWVMPYVSKYKRK